MRTNATGALCILGGHLMRQIKTLHDFSRFPCYVLSYFSLVFVMEPKSKSRNNKIQLEHDVNAIRTKKTNVRDAENHFRSFAGRPTTWSKNQQVRAGFAGFCKIHTHVLFLYLHLYLCLY